MYSTITFYNIFDYRFEHYSEKNNSTMKILIKLPSRSRPKRLIEIVKNYIYMAENPSSIDIMINLDSDDPTVTPELCSTLKSIHSTTDIHIGTSHGKISAVNRDMELAKDYDILLLASDDMFPIVKGYDDIIRNDMQEHYPDTDGVLWYNDGNQGKKLNTLCILGRTYYKRFNYIYHPSYKSLYCDNEFTEVANKLNKQTYFDNVIIKHNHPGTFQGVENDELYETNQKYAYEDRDNYYKRRSQNFS
jgi:hypothetical protein